ncbi:carbohydrate ABC transporter substrate-binding protein (CUT1 family) [Scopulibacillus darangshiensis]|uniref:Carbohydrate ABC transporter substrate-binding protein (CUT1 family) n=1 Tax=Scopulibacillus darangshiensis TaxID=442528 RepID=A0A4R2NK57_9BACL|nr:extracellular solute-binding protein [Scopulibacillus darangshiensis]TCP21877.1 carbohydrate ABC transporter substrate-binding protein (CUT1 family) [Scopulibacillus darangshiensis]
MKRKALKACSLLFALVMLSSILFGCSNDESASGDGKQSGDVYKENGLPKDKEVTLKMAYFTGGQGKEIIDYAIKTFTKKFPNVHFDVMASPDIAKIIQTRVSAGNSEEMFDLFNREVPGGMLPLVKEGLLEPEEDLWDHKLYDTPDKKIKDVALEGEYEGRDQILGKTYAVPVDSTAGGLFYNKKMFEKHGWNQNPKTWDEFKKLLADIKGEGISPIIFPGMYPYYYDNAFGYRKLFEIAEMNGNLKEFTKDYKEYNPPVFLSPENIERWKRIYELGKAGYFPKGLAALSHTQSQMQVIQGKAAMVSTGSWVENEMKKSAPDFEWGFMAVPFVEKPGQTIWVRHTPGHGFYIWKDKPELHKKWAKEFTVWLWNLKVQKVFAEKGGTLPVRKDFLDDKKRADSLQSAAKAVLKYTKENNVRMATGHRDVSLSDPRAKQANKLRDEAIVNIFLGKEKPMPMLKKAEKLIDEAIKAEKKK